MNKIIFIVFLFLNPLFSYSQSDYWAQTNGPFGGTAHDYSFAETDIVYAATDAGVYKSTDNGERWNNLGLQGNITRSICKLTTGNLLAGVYNTGLYRSTDEGSNWTFLNGYGQYINKIKEIKDFVLIASSNGLFKSLNEGITTRQVLSIGNVTSIDTSSNDEIYVSTYFNGIYKSTNSGENWSKLDSLNGYTITVDVATNGYVFASNWNWDIYRSTDNGKNFSVITPPELYKATCCLTTNDNYLYCGSFYTGIWRSSDYGDNWQKQYLGERYNFFVRNLCEGFKGDVFAAVDNCGIVRSTDHGRHWNRFKFRDSYLLTNVLLQSNDGKIFSNTGHVSIDNGLNWVFPDLYFLPTSFAKDKLNGFIYATDGSSMNTEVRGVIRSTNYGVDWELMNIPNVINGVSYVYVSGNGNIYAQAGNGLFESTNYGIDWIQISSLSFYNIDVNALNYIYGKRSGGLYRSTNNGQDWQVILPLSDINGAVYTTNSGDLYSGGSGTLFKSTNNGDNWTQENISGPVSSIIENQNGRIFVSLYGIGVFMKNGDTWTDITHNISNRNIYTLCFNQTGQLLAGTTTGVFRTNASVIGISSSSQNIPDQFFLYQNYPNPFNPVTAIRYSLNKNSFTTLKIFDAVGKEVETLINEKQNAGSYEVKFDGSNLASGIYFYNLTAGDFNETKKMLLIK